MVYGGSGCLAVDVSVALGLQHIFNAVATVEGCSTFSRDCSLLLIVACVVSVVSVLLQSKKMLAVLSVLGLQVPCNGQRTR